MKKIAYCVIAGILGITSSTGAYAAKVKTKAKASMYDANGLFLGNVDFSTTKAGVVVKATLKQLPPGFHGFHIHAVGECVSPFTSAGAHFEYGDDTHHQHHNGDMPVLLVSAHGNATATFVTDRYRVNRLFDDNGKGRAVIIHAAADNYANIPARYFTTNAGTNTPGPDATTLGAGDAGARIACGIIK